MLLWTKKNLHCTIKIFIFTISKKPRTLDGNLDMHYIWHNKVVSFLQILFKGKHLITVIVLVILYCFETTSSFSSSLIFEKFQIMSVMSFGVFIVKLEHISHLFLVFTVDFEQLGACWNWTMCNCSENCPKRTPTRPKQYVPFRRCPL